MAYILYKNFENILGLDLRVSDLLRRKGAATQAQNVMFRQTGALSKRKGFQIKTLNDTGGAGIFKYNNIDIDTGVITEEMLTLDDNLHMYEEKTFTVTYTGSESAYYDLYYSPTDEVYYFDVYNDNTRVLNQDLGKGTGASDTTVTQLSTAIDGLTDFSSSVSGSPTTPAAYMNIARTTTISSSGTSFSWYEWTQVDTPNNYSTPFSSHWAARNGSDFELANAVSVSDVLFITNGYDDLHKYDANRVYKVGLPKPSDPTVAEIAGSTFGTGEVHDYKYSYEYTDAKGNIIESNLSDAGSITGTGTFDYRVTLSNIQDTTGYNTDQAVIDGAQSGVTQITVDSGHNIKVNDTVYINDGITGLVVSRLVTATTATTITISGDSVDVTNNEIISCIKLKVYRTKDASTLYYELVELINDSNSATQTYDDSIADSNITVDLVEPVKTRDLPPKAKYADVWRDTLILTGNREDVNKVYYSDITSAEYFPTSNNFILSAKQGGGNSGLKVLDNTLFVFKPEAILSVTGDLSTDNFRVDPFSDEGIGCVAHASIKELNRRIWFLSTKGVFSINSESLKNESDPIEPRFNDDYNSKQAVGYHWIDKDMYVLLLPSISTDSGSEDYFGSSSKIVVYDKFRNAWLDWTNWNMLGGMVEYNDEIYISGRELDPSNSLAKNYTKKVLENGTLDDYMDHDTAIAFSYKTHWESLGEPSVFKKFNRIKVLSLDGSINDFETDNFSLDIETEHDYTPGAVSTLTLDMSGGSTGWGEGAWGSFVWGESRLSIETSKLASKKAKALRVVFKNSNAQQNVLISGFELEIAAPYQPVIKE